MDKKRIIILALIVGGIYMATKAPRGIRNHNPGNIKKTGDNWRGLRDPQEDKVFFQFVEPKFGIRALARILRNYNSLYGLDTVEGIISRYAPKSENETDLYIDFVAWSMGVRKDQELDLSGVHMETLIAAIIKFENGQQPYTMEQVREGVSLA